MTELYFEQIAVGHRSRSGPYLVTEQEIIEFGRRFDPRPYHVDPVAARQSIFGGLVAPGCLVFAIRCALANRIDPGPAYRAGLGLETMELQVPVRPGDRLELEMECVSRRELRSRRAEGLVHFRNTLANQDGKTVMSMLAKALVARCP